MLPDTIRRAIFTTIPREAHGKTAAVAWADIADITAMLRKSPISITLALSSDMVDGSWTSATRLRAVAYEQDRQIHTRGQYRIVTLTINVHTRTNTGADIIDAYMEELQTWALNTLPDCVNVAGDNGVLDLSFLEAGMLRRQTSFALRYLQTADAAYENINDIDADITLS